MPSLNPLFRVIAVYVIHDRERDCFLGKETDHWMVISLKQLRDLRFFETAADAWAEIGGRPGLDVRELMIDLVPGTPTAGDAADSSQAASEVVSVAT